MLSIHKTKLAKQCFANLKTFQQLVLVGSFMRAAFGALNFREFAAFFFTLSNLRGGGKQNVGGRVKRGF